MTRARPRKPRTPPTAPAVQAVLVSQHTAPAVLGFRSARAFLDWLPTAQRRGCKVLERGKDRLVALDDALAALAAATDVAKVPTDVVEEVRQPSSESEVLAELGLRPLRLVAGSR